jgi:hypothetical protein
VAAPAAAAVAAGVAAAAAAIGIGFLSTSPFFLCSIHQNDT